MLIYRLNNYQNWEGLWKRIFALTSTKFCVPTLQSEELEMTIFIMHS